MGLGCKYGWLPNQLQSNCNLTYKKSMLVLNLLIKTCVGSRMLLIVLQCHIPIPKITPMALHAAFINAEEIKIGVVPVCH